MDLDSDGWPQLPPVGAKIKFHGGGVLLNIMGVCTILRAEHVANAAGRPGGRVTVRTARGDHVELTLSQVRDHAEYVEDE